MGSPNFGFLSQHDARLVALGGFAESYFRDDPSTAIVKLRQFAELTAKLVAAHHAVYRDERETFEEMNSISSRANGAMRRKGFMLVARQPSNSFGI